MKILKNILEKKQENSNILFTMRRRELALFEHISVYMHSLIFLEEDDLNLDEKIKLWNKFFNSSGKSKLKYYKKLVFFKNKEDKIIMEALNKIEINKMSDSSRGFSLFPDGVVAIPTFVHEESD